jgi:lysophospholipase L1-like esterase
MNTKKYLNILATTPLVLVIVVLLIGQATPSKAVSSPQRIVFVGDSITIGQSLGDSTKALTSKIQKRNTNWFVRNYSFIGASASGEGSFNGSLSKPAVDPYAVSALYGELSGGVYAIFIGASDWLNGVATSSFKQKYANFLDVISTKFLFIPPKIVCVTPIWQPLEKNPNTVGIYLSEYRTIIKNECQARNMPIIDGLSLIPNIAGYYVDEVYPNSSGYSIFATRLYGKLRLYIPE